MSYFFGSDAHEIIDSVSALEAIEACGVEMKKAGRNYLILCPDPSHNDTHLGSCVVMPQKNGRCRCFACQKEFNSLDIMMMCGGYSWYDGMVEIARMSGRLEAYNQKGKSEKPKRRLRPLTTEEKALIGLDCQNKSKAFYNVSFDKPDGDYSYNEDTEMYECYRYFPSPLSLLLKNDPIAYAGLVRRKCAEKLLYLLNLREAMDEPKTREQVKITRELHKCGIEKEGFLSAIESVYADVFSLYKLYGGKINALLSFITAAQKAPPEKLQKSA